MQLITIETFTQDFILFNDRYSSSRLQETYCLFNDCINSITLLKNLTILFCSKNELFSCDLFLVSHAPHEFDIESQCLRNVFF